MFKNITQGAFYIRELLDENSSFEIDFKNDYACMNTLAYTANVDVNIDEERANAEFIAFCFNLQQKYDILKFEECVLLLEKQLDYLDAGINISVDSVLHDKIEQLLKQIKK